MLTPYKLACEGRWTALPSASRQRFASLPLENQSRDRRIRTANGLQALEIQSVITLSFIRDCRQNSLQNAIKDVEPDIAGIPIIVDIDRHEVWVCDALAGVFLSDNEVARKDCHANGKQRCPTDKSSHATTAELQIENESSNAGSEDLTEPIAKVLQCPGAEVEVAGAIDCCICEQNQQQLMSLLAAYER